MKMRVADDDSEDLSTRLRSRIVQLKSQITDADSKRTKIIDKVARAKIEISRIQKEKAEQQEQKVDPPIDFDQLQAFLGKTRKNSCISKSSIQKIINYIWSPIIIEISCCFIANAI